MRRAQGSAPPKPEIDTCRKAKNSSASVGRFGKDDAGAEPDDDADEWAMGGSL
jgi:hypothetical protein